MRVGVDIGGTFTDLVAVTADKQLLNSKALSTPEDQSKGILECIRKSGMDLSEAELILHGSTVAINTVIERKGAKTALITTRGFRDVYEIGRENRIQSYNMLFKKADPLVKRRHRYEVSGRLDYQGNEIEPIDEAEVRALADTLRKEGIESVAICMLFSYLNPEHEKTVERILKEELPDVYFSVSSDILKEVREYERTSTTVLNAYVGPIVVRYLQSLERDLEKLGFKGQLLMMQSNGGAMSVETTKQIPVAMMESGPVSGVMGAAQVGASLGYNNVISFDMGGTTAKSSLVKDMKMQYTTNGYYIGGIASGHPMMLPVVDIVEVGAGGGSIAWIDAAGAIKVGPISSGAMPGPICYGRGGTEPTVTDANVVLNRLGENNFLGGEMDVKSDKAREAIAAMGEKLGLDWKRTAFGILEIANAKMALSIREVSIERGYDPRDFVLVASGGAGPLHAVSLARDLSIPIVIVPQLPGQFSALGMLMGDLQHNYVQTFLSPLETADEKELMSKVNEMTDHGREVLLGEGADEDKIEMQVFFDLRYIGQEFTISTPVEEKDLSPESRASIKARFDALHQQMYGHCAEHEKAQIIALRVIAKGLIGDKSLSEGSVQDQGDGKPYGYRPVYIDNETGFMDCPVYKRSNLYSGQEIIGPAVIEEYASTTLIFPGDRLTVSDKGHMVIHLAKK
jgi:N-methylhydantoinase A